MISSYWDRSRRIAAAAASVLAVVAVAAAVLFLAFGASLPEAWWPRTGQAFATDASRARQDPCHLLVDPTKEYCERDTRATTRSAAQAAGDGAGAVWKLVPAAAGLAALVLWRRRGAAGQGRR